MSDDPPVSASLASPQEEARQHLAALRRQIEALPASERAALLATLAAFETAHAQTVAAYETASAQATAPPDIDETRYRSVIAQLSDGIALGDAQGRIIEWNVAQERITGIARSEAIGRYVWDIQFRLAPEEHRTPANLEANRARVQNLLKTGHAPWLNQTVENEFQRQDGMRGILQARIFLIQLRNSFLFGSVLRDITEQKQTEEALRQSEERLRAIFESAQDAIFMKDRNLVYTHVNPIIEKQNRMPADQIIGKTDAELFGDEFAASIRESELSVLAGEVDEQETSGVIQGVSYTFHAIKVPVRDSTGAIIGLCGFARDITERQRTQRELQESEARYRALVNAITAGIFVVQDGRYVFANPEAARLVGVQDPAEIEGIPALDLIDPAYHAQMRPRVANLDSGQPNPPIALKLARADGKIVFVELSSVPISLQGRPAALIVCQDITARTEIEEALRSSQELYHQLLAASPNVITLGDLAGRIVFASQQARETYRIEHMDRVIGRPLLDFVSPEDRERAARDLQNLFATEQPTSAQYLLLRDDGTRFTAEVSAAVLRGPDDRPNGIVAITHDITERLEADRHRLDLAIERERTSVLTDFLQNASHEFSAPLSVINAELYMLLRSVESPDLLARLRRLQDHAKQIDELVKAMLTMSRLDSGLPFSFVPTDLNQLVQDTVSRMRPHAGEKRLRLHVDLDDSWPIVESDPQELHLALAKLLENAIRFTPAGGAIMVRTRAAETRVTIAIQDTGIGISAEDLPHVIERFYRVDKARTSRGAGLGLSIAAKIIESHNGEIQIESTPRVGTTVTITLPNVVNGGIRIV